MPPAVEKESKKEIKNDKSAEQPRLQPAEEQADGKERPRGERSKAGRSMQNARKRERRKGSGTQQAEGRSKSWTAERPSKKAPMTAAKSAPRGAAKARVEAESSGSSSSSNSSSKGKKAMAEAPRAKDTKRRSREGGDEPKAKGLDSAGGGSSRKSKERQLEDAEEEICQSMAIRALHRARDTASLDAVRAMRVVAILGDIRVPGRNSSSSSGAAVAERQEASHSKRRRKSSS